MSTARNQVFATRTGQDHVPNDSRSPARVMLSTAKVPWGTCEMLAVLLGLRLSWPAFGAMPVGSAVPACLFYTFSKLLGHRGFFFSISYFIASLRWCIQYKVGCILMYN